jgi:hypothetical protein
MLRVGGEKFLTAVDDGSMVEYDALCVVDGEKQYRDKQRN